MSIKIRKKEKAFKSSIFTNKKLKVGIFESAKYDDGTPVAQVAFWQEFGTAKIPMRPFFRNAIAKNTRKWGDSVNTALIGTNDSEKALKMLGEIMRGDIVLSLTNLNTPPNAPSTIKQKGSSNPLIDTGLLRNSISWELA
jgi:hypothetical protein|nr:MAG TPA_asm: virion morphogenesis protein [Caudoviricetes sp.]